MATVDVESDLPVSKLVDIWNDLSDFRVVIPDIRPLIRFRVALVVASGEGVHLEIRVEGHGIITKVLRKQHSAGLRLSAHYIPIPDWCYTLDLAA